MEAIEKVEYKGKVINVYQDEDTESPREWDNLGVMYNIHKDYQLGDKQIRDIVTMDNVDTWDDIYKELGFTKDDIVMDLYLYDHSGLRIKIGSFDGLLPQGHAEFDSGRVGFIVATADKIKKEYNVKRISKKLWKTVVDVLRGEVETYDKYLSGSVYRYDSEAGSCGGFYDEKQMIEEAKSEIDYHLTEEEKKKEKKLKAQILNNVPLQYRTA
jgi:hypothetical protein